jgi:hypothetical protein
MHLVRTLNVATRDDATGIVTLSTPIEVQSPKLSAMSVSITFTPVAGAPPELKVGKKVIVDVMTK